MANIYVLDVNDENFAAFVAYIINVGRADPDNIQVNCQDGHVTLTDLDIISFTWLIGKLSSYQTEESFRVNFMLPLVASIDLQERKYPVINAINVNRKAIDIRQVFWILRLLKMMSSMANWRITSPPVDAFTLWVYLVVRRMSEIVLVIYRMNGLDPLGNNPVIVMPPPIPLIEGANPYSFPWFTHNTFNPLSPEKNVGNVYELLKDVSNSITGSAATQSVGPLRIMKFSVTNPIYIGSAAHNANRKFLHDNNVINAAIPYVPVLPPVITVLIRRIVNLVEDMHAKRALPAQKNGQIWNEFVPPEVRWVIQNVGAIGANLVAQAAINAQAFIANGVPAAIANIGLNAHLGAQLFVQGLPPAQQNNQPAYNQARAIIHRREEAIAARRLDSEERNAAYFNQALQVLAPLLQATQQANVQPLNANVRVEARNIMAAIGRQGGNFAIGADGLISLESLLGLAIFGFEVNNQINEVGNVCEMLRAKFINCGVLCSYFETQWSTLDNFITRMTESGIPRPISERIFNGLQMLTSL